MSGISDSRWRSNRFTGDQVIFTGDQIDSPRSASKITKCVTGLKNKEPSKRKNYAPLIKLMEDDDSNLLREEIPLDNIVDDTADVIRESPSRVLIIISAFFFTLRPAIHCRSMRIFPEKWLDPWSRVKFVRCVLRYIIVYRWNNLAKRINRTSLTRD